MGAGKEAKDDPPLRKQARYPHRRIPRSRRCHETGIFHALGPETFGHQESELERLARVQPRIACGLIAIVQIDLADRLCAAKALGHVLSGHLEMNAARMRSLGAMHREESPHLF